MDGGLPDDTAHELVAHLIADNLALGHAPSAGGCYGTPAEVDPNWPNGGSPETGEVGYDVAEEEPIPDDYADWTSFCAPRWISPYTANNVIDAFRTGGVAAAQTAGLTPGDFWLVSGLLDEDAGTAEFDPLFELETEGSVEAGTGLYRVEVRDSVGGVLFTRFFAVDDSQFEDEGPQASQDADVVRFAELIPVQANAAKIVVISGSNEVGELELGGVTPVVQLTSGISLSVAGAPPLPKFSWNVADSDSASHNFWLELSHDGGQTWDTIAPRFSGDTFAVDPAFVGGGEGLLLRVRASDGVNTGVAVTEPFNLQKQAPQGAISAPASGATFATGDLVWLQAAIVDPEDGVLAGGSVTWSSSRDGSLGTGASLQLYDLSVGTHTISFLAKDSDNNELADSITITVSNTTLSEGDVERTWGDNNCSGAVDPVDSLLTLRFDSGQSASTGECPAFGEQVEVPGGANFPWGDIDCSGDVALVDALKLLRFDAGLSAAQGPGCPILGEEVMVAVKD
ncbi:MAG TPA: hypothetical protein VMR52_09010 [Dehalococcoidia bacterium]|nr:hypothetical protein [Dehalococcoidia bacterium]